MKRFFSLLLLSALLIGTLPAFAFAEEGSKNDSDEIDESEDLAEFTDDEDELEDELDDELDDKDEDEAETESDEMVEVDDDFSEEVEDAVEEAVESVFESEGEVESDEGGEETVVVEEVNESDFTDEVEEDLEEVAESGTVPDTFYLSVQWGLFPAEVPAEGTKGAETDWSGSVIFEDDDSTASLVARPYKQLRFEKDQDAIDFENTTMNETVFDSLIYVHNDGLFFKVRTDVDDTTTKIVFDTAYENSQLAVYTTDLLAKGGVEFTIGEYKVVMKVWTREDWVQKHSEHGKSGSGEGEPGRGQNKGERAKPLDAESGAWYEDYMNYSVDEGLFQGYKNEKGELTGKIGPGDSLTRFQLLKVLTRLAETLDIGVGALSCDEESNISNSETDWMGTHWARGYVQCALDAGYEVTLLEEVIGETVETGEMPTLRWEVLVTAAELLGVEVPERKETPSDVETSGLDEEGKDSIGYFYELGVVNGYPDGSFKPERTVNRAEMFKIVVLLLESLGM